MADISKTKEASEEVQEEDKSYKVYYLDMKYAPVEEIIELLFEEGDSKEVLDIWLKNLEDYGGKLKKLGGKFEGKRLQIYPDGQRIRVEGDSATLEMAETEQLLIKEEYENLLAYSMGKKKKDIKEYPINDFITLKFEDNSTNIYVKDKCISQCKRLLFNIPLKNIEDYDEVNSIDETIDLYNKFRETYTDISYQIPPETEFWGHCSNIEVWAENNYDTRLLHSNLAFPLLRELFIAGDPQAKRVFEEEICKIFR